MDMPYLSWYSWRVMVRVLMAADSGMRSMGRRVLGIEMDCRGCRICLRDAELAGCRSAPVRRWRVWPANGRSR